MLHIVFFSLHPHIVFSWCDTFYTMRGVSTMIHGYFESAQHISTYLVINVFSPHIR